MAKTLDLESELMIAPTIGDSKTAAIFSSSDWAGAGLAEADELEACSADEPASDSVADSIGMSSIGPAEAEPEPWLEPGVAGDSAI